MIYSSIGIGFEISKIFEVRFYPLRSRLVLDVFANIRPVLILERLTVGFRNLII